MWPITSLYFKIYKLKNLLPRVNMEVNICILLRRYIFRLVYEKIRVSQSEMHEVYIGRIQSASSN